MPQFKEFLGLILYFVTIFTVMNVPTGKSWCTAMMSIFDKITGGAVFGSVAINSCKAAFPYC
jgi:hypothetical protein